MVDPRALDIGYLALFVGYAFTDKVQAKLAVGFEGLRFAHGSVFQHLVEGPRTLGELAAALEVSQQAASKSIAELEALGYVERVADEADARVRRVRLSERGRGAVARARKIRASLERKLAAERGARAIEQCRAVLADVLESLGGAEAVKKRRVRGPR